MLPDTVMNGLKSIVGDKGWTSDDTKLEPHVTEWRDRLHGKTPLMLLPESTQQVSDILALCNKQGVAVVPQGGNTGLCGGAIPDESNTQVLLNLSRMNRVRQINPDDFSITAEAGCVLHDLQETAADHDRLFPLSLAAEGSCQIGGNLATDAGGINVVRYGTARDQVLGLEVVLANGDVIEGLRSLRKDTAGYDLRHLFVGSEGTLGVITAATLKLYPSVKTVATAMVSLPDAEASVRLLAALRSQLGDRVQAFELISGMALGFVRRHKPELKVPFGDGDWFVLLEIDGETGELEQGLMGAHEGGFVTDAVLAKNDAERDNLWQIRHSISQVQKFEGVSIKHDVAVPIDRIPEFFRLGDEMLANLAEGARLCAFGHVGDGNLHYNVSQPVDADAESFLAKANTITEALYRIVRDLDGTFSAEHGVGLFKRDTLPMFRSEAEMRLMQTLKTALDPKGILNPGKAI